MKYGVNVFGIDCKLDRSDIANKAIDETYKFFESIGIPMHLKEVGIDESRLAETAHHVAENERDLKTRGHRFPNRISLIFSKHRFN